MNATRSAEILRQLEQSGATDAELLARFAATKDAAAFEVLVRRHGTLVLGVCRRVTRNPLDAEDAFQATFLVLAQKAHFLRNAALLGNWLYGVAFRVAWRARRSVARRSAREVTMSSLPDYPAPAQSSSLPELPAVLDEELAALAGCYREAIVLCDLRGASREEAAAALGIPEGTLSSRLANGRKKLAARLAKRGVALSIALLPSVLSELQATAILPNELLTKTCGLIADFSASSAVPGPLVKLTQGGFTVRKTLVFGLVLTAVVTGAVLAASPRDGAPLPNPPKVPAVVETPAEQPKPKEEAKTVENAIAYTTAPKLRRSFDLSVGWGLTVVWNATGTHLAVAGLERRGAWGGPANRPVVWLFGAAGDSKPIAGYPIAGALVAVAPDGKGVITDLREYKLISGDHQLTYWSESRTQPPNEGGAGVPRPASLVEPMLIVSKTVKLDSTETHGYTFATEGKAFRAVAWENTAIGDPARLEVLEVDATTGKTVKSLLKTDFGEAALSANGKRLAVLDKEMMRVTVYDLDRGEKLSEYVLPVDKTVELPGGKTVELPHRPEQPFLKLSPDGRRLVVSRGIGQNHVLNADTGAPLPRLEGASLAQSYLDAHAFSGDGRLLAAVCRVYKVVNFTSLNPKGNPKAVEQTSLSGGDQILTVWDTQTGKVLKSWKSGNGVRWAFCPTKPLLAILEENGEGNTRVGLWDFAAEVEKK